MPWLVGSGIPDVSVREADRPPEIPKRYAIPSATALLAYVNAKYGVAWDLWSIRLVVGFMLWMKRREGKDRVNLFYDLEKWAKDPKSAKRVFVLIPNDPSKPDQRAEWTYAEAYEAVLKYAAWLKNKYGVQKNEWIAMDFTNKPQFIWMWFAIWSLGAIPAFINHNQREKSFVHSVRVSTARILFIDPQIKEVLTDDTRRELGADEKGRAVDTVVVEPKIEQEILAQTPYRAPDEARSGAKFASTAMLIYTSGTTGFPKAANVNWAKPLSGIGVWAELLGLKSTDRYFTALPLYHSSGSLLGVCPVLG